MTTGEDFFKEINKTAKDTNTYEQKTLSYFFNKKDNCINPYEDNVYPFSHKYLPPEQYNELNLHNYRSDNFLTNHDGNHILFSGCSNTFGFGLNKEEMWSKIVYDKINKNIKCSGYFNLSTPGGGIQLIISNLFRYFKEFGHPNYIFLNLPEHERFIGYMAKSNSYTKINFSGKNLDLESEQFFSIINYQYYFMLEQYCKTNNIKLYSSSWIIGDNRANTKKKSDFFSSFKTFYYADPLKMLEDVTNDEKKYNLEYYFYARDKSHKGAGYNIWLANFMYDIYKKDNEKKL